MTEIKFGTSGWRGILAEDFTFANARRVCQAIAAYLHQEGLADRGVVIGYDTRFRSEAFAVADRVIDTMGAGDAALAVTSPFAALGFPMVDLVKIGNAAGAAKVATLGHRRAVRREDLHWI